MGFASMYENMLERIFGSRGSDAGHDSGPSDSAPIRQAPKPLGRAERLHKVFLLAQQIQQQQEVVAHKLIAAAEQVQRTIRERDVQTLREVHAPKSLDGTERLHEVFLLAQQIQQRQEVVAEKLLDAAEQVRRTIHERHQAFDERLAEASEAMREVQIAVGLLRSSPVFDRIHALRMESEQLRREVNLLRHEMASLREVIREARKQIDGWTDGGR